MSQETEALYRALHKLAYLVDENVPVAQESRELNSALAYAFELLEEIRVPGTPKSDAARKWARDNGAAYHDVPLCFDDYLGNDPERFEMMRNITQILNQ
jgi:hypothetical protein